MQTWKKALALLGILFLVGAGCGSTTTEEETHNTAQNENVPPATLAEGYSSYKDEAGWSIGYPEAWQVVTDPQTPEQVFFLAPYVESENEFEHSVSVTVTPNTQPVDAAQMAEELRAFLTQLGASSIIDSGTVAIPEGEAAKISYTVTDPASGEELYGTQVGFFDGTTLYVMTFTASEVGKDAFTDEFEEMYTSFRVR